MRFAVQPMAIVSRPGRSLSLSFFPSMAHQFQEHTQGRRSSSEIQIQILRGELDAANKRVDRYVHLVASLYEELDNLRRSICYNCKKKFVPSHAPDPLSSDVARPRPSFWRRIVSGRPTQNPLSGPPVLPTITGGSPTAIRIATEQNQTNSAISTLDSSSAIPTRPSVAPIVELQSEKPNWSVSHNPKVKQALHVHLVRTFKCPEKVFCVRFSPNGKYLAAGLPCGKTYIYDVENGFKIWCLVDIYLKDPPAVWCVQFSPDNKYIATTSGQQMRLWEVERKRTRAVFPVATVALCFSPNGHFLVTGDRRIIRIFCLRDGSSKTLVDNCGTTLSFTFSPDGRHVASVDFGCWLRIWDARTGQVLDTWNGESQVGRCVAFSPDGRGLVSGGGDGILRYWDVSSLANLKRGRDLMIGGTPGQRFPQIRKFEGHTALVRSLSFSPDCQWLATSSQDQSVRIWNPHNAEWQCTLHGHDAYARTVDFCAAEKYLASGGEDHQVRLWKYRDA